MNEKITISDLSITVIEPSSTQWRIIQSELQKLGIDKLEHFNDGQSALKDIQRFEPDLVISSMHLPDMTGTDLVQTMRETKELEHIPFMLVSSELSDYYLEPIRQAGVIAILPKPFQSQALRSALFSTLEFIEPDIETLANFNLDALNVLVVDDSPTALKHICRVLNNMGIENITTAVNGVDAVETLNNNFFDLIVTDYNMPEMDGKELTKHVREKSTQSSIPILMVTSEATNSHLAGVKQSGVSALCDKPFEPGAVKQLIRNILTITD